MGFLDIVKDIGIGALKSATGGLVDLGGSYLSNELIGQPNAATAYGMSKEAADTQWERQKQAATTAFERSQMSAETAFKNSEKVYNSRYQRTVNDMRAAGINPILAASSGFNVGSGPQQATAIAPAAQPVSAQAFKATGYPTQVPSQSALALERTGLASSEAFKKRQEAVQVVADTRLKLMQVLTEFEKQYNIRSQRDLNVASENKAYVETQRIFKETDRIVKDAQLKVAQGKKIAAEINVLEKQFEKLRFNMNELRRTSAIYGAPAGHILKFFELLIKSLTPFKFMQGE